jgi:hypothetical protein
VPRMTEAVCPECNAVMLSGKRPLRRIFGPIHSLECPRCEFAFYVKLPNEPNLVGQRDGSTRVGQPGAEEMVGTKLTIPTIDTNDRRLSGRLRQAIRQLILRLNIAQ